MFALFLYRTNLNAAVFCLFMYVCIFFAPKILIFSCFLFLLTFLAFVCAVSFRKFLHFLFLVEAGTKNFQCVFKCYSRDEVFEKSNLFLFSLNLYMQHLCCSCCFFLVSTFGVFIFQTFYIRIIFFARFSVPPSCHLYQAGFSQDWNLLQQIVVSASKSSFCANCFVFKVFIKFFSQIFLCFV